MDFRKLLAQFSHFIEMTTETGRADVIFPKSLKQIGPRIQFV